MKYSIGDKVVHPSHGPGLVMAIERKEFSDEARGYYVIQIPDKDLILYVPRKKADLLGIRPAMARPKLMRVFETLSDQPAGLPLDYKERQDAVWEKLKTGRPILIAEVVRDLAWRKEHLHLTKKDNDLLSRGQKLLAAEMALVADTGLAEANAQIEAALAASMTRAA